LAAGRKAGGPETYEVQLVRALAAAGAQEDFFIYCTSPGAAEAIGPLPENFRVRLLRPALRPISVSLTLPRWMAIDGVDLFHATYAAPPFPIRPFVFTMHCVSNFAHPEYYPTFIRWRLNALQRVALRRAASILCVSDFVAAYLRDALGVPGERLSTVYNGVGPEFTPVAPELARRRIALRFGIHYPYLFYAGKLQARKNIVRLIQAYAFFRKLTGSPAKLVLAGRRVQTSEGIDETIARLGLAEQVVELGYIAPPSADPDSLLPSLYSAARMTMFVSLYEGFGIPVIEAMACGSPVIASSATSLPEVAGGAALLVNPESVEDIGRAMAWLDRDEDLRARLIQQGISRAGRFTWEQCARQTLEAYRRLHAGRLRRR
jgi:glycosyltransferase involved in cell wall biosynthesis